jgi:hypothetical protein
MADPRTTVFVSYCRRNRRWLERLQIHLKPYADRGLLDVWDDTKIQPGAKWQREISEALARASASIVLISADFLASDFVAVHELPVLLQKAQDAGALILPIYVEPADLANHQELAAFQALNQPGRPLAVMSRAAAERVLAQAVKTVGHVVAGRASRPAPDASALPSTPDERLLEELLGATHTLSMLWCLSGAPEGGTRTLGEFEACLAIRSRKRAFESVSRLVAGGWLSKTREEGATRYRLTPEGIRQWQRLVAATDGPLRRAAARG